MRITQTLERAGAALPPDIDMSHAADQALQQLSEPVRLQLDAILEEGHPAIHAAVHAVPDNVIDEKARFVSVDVSTGQVSMYPDQLKSLLAAASIGGASVVLAWVGDSLAVARQLEEQHLTPPEA